jgi:phage shock protein A
MAGFFSRIVSLIKSNANDAVSKFEDPSKMLNQVILEMNQSLVEAKKQVAVAIADEKRLGKQLESAQLNGKEWEKKAMMAVRAGDDGLAKEALNRKVDQDKLTAEYQKQHTLQKDATDKLKTALRGLQGKIDEARRKKDLLIARQKRTEAQKTIQSTLNNLGNNSAFDTFDRMSQKVDQMEAEAEAQSELQLEQGAGVGGLDDRFAQLEAANGTDDALAALKAKMGLAPAASTPQLEQQHVRPQVNVQVSEPAAVGSNRGSSSGDLDF